MSEETPQVAFDAEAEAARDRIASTVDQLEERLNPRNIVRGVLGDAQASGARLLDQVSVHGSALVDQARSFAGDNRQALSVGGALAGAAVVIGLVRRRRLRREEDGDWATSYDGYGTYVFEDEDDEMSDAYETGSASAYDSVSLKAQGALGAAKQKASDLASKLSSGAGSAKDRLSDTYQSVRERGSDYAGQAKDWTSSTYSANPFIGIFAGLAAGALLGVLIPETERENELLGETRDRLADRARSTANSALDAGKAKLDELGLNKDGLQTKLADLANQAKDAAQNVGQAVVSEVKPAAH